MTNYPSSLPITLPVSNSLSCSLTICSYISADDAKELAQLCALNALAAISLVAELDQIERVVRVGGFVNCAPGFTAIPGVVNGASELLIKIFGDINGKHARTAVGVAELPLNAPVEIEMVVQLKN